MDALAGCEAVFVHPEEPTAAEAIAAIADEFELLGDWDERFRHIIELGRGLKKQHPFPPAWMDAAHFVPGCASNVWMGATRADGLLLFGAEADAFIAAGLVAMLLRVYSGRPAAEILANDPCWIKELGLLGSLSVNRGNGVAAMAQRIQAEAREAVRGG